MKVTCKNCKRGITCSEEAYHKRLKKYEDEDDMEKNYLCRKCRKE